jgi:hypothetical protein
LRRGEFLKRLVQRVEHGDRVQDLPDRRYEFSHFSGHTGKMSSEVEHRSPDVLLLLLWFLSRACLVLKCPDPRHLFVTGSALLKIADDLTVSAVFPRFPREIDPVLQIGYFIGDVLFKLRAFVSRAAGRSRRRAWLR